MKFNRYTCLLLPSIALLLTACGHNAQPQEHYNSVLITEYNNTYDNAGRLVNVKAVNTHNLYYSQDKAYILTSNSLQQYIYSNDTDYIATEISDSDIKTTSRHKNIKEELWLKDGKDTTFYSFTRYYAKDKPEYIKDISASADTPSEKQVSESFYTYDSQGELLKTTDTDLITGQKTERYFFKGITYEEALQKIPHSECTQEIVCENTTTNNDTVIVLTTIDGAPSKTRKEYRDGELRIEVLNREFEDFHWTDSTYYKNGMKFKETSIDSNRTNKTITISIYDEKGHLLKETDKYKYNISTEQEDLLPSYQIPYISDEL